MFDPLIKAIPAGHDKRNKIDPDGDQYLILRFTGEKF